MKDFVLNATVSYQKTWTMNSPWKVFVTDAAKIKVPGAGMP
jgi:hypothetical protein